MIDWRFPFYNKPTRWIGPQPEERFPGAGGEIERTELQRTDWAS